MQATKKWVQHSSHIPDSWCLQYWACMEASSSKRELTARRARRSAADFWEALRVCVCSNGRFKYAVSDTWCCCLLHLARPSFPCCCCCCRVVVHGVQDLLVQTRCLAQQVECPARLTQFPLGQVSNLTANCKVRRHGESKRRALQKGAGGCS